MTSITGCSEPPFDDTDPDATGEPSPPEPEMIDGWGRDYGWPEHERPHDPDYRRPA